MVTAAFKGVRACVFDAYGTLFDVDAAARHLADEIGERWTVFSATWRAKQLQYTWLRATMGRHEDFWAVTQAALDFAMDAANVKGDGLRRRLLDLYWALDAFEEVKDVLAELKGQGLKTAILSNGSPDMLKGAIEAAGIGNLLDDCLSVEDVGIFKPAPAVYRLACDRLKVQPGEISFQSSNGWDAAAAKAFGFQVAWINRTGQPRERLPWPPDLELKDLRALPSVVGPA